MRPWIAILAAVTSVMGAATFMQARATAVPTREAPGLPASSPPVAKSAAVLRVGPPAAPPPLAGIDLSRLVVREDGATAPGPRGRVAHLSIDPALQRTTHRILRDYAIPEAAVVLMDVAGGRVLAWVSHVQQGPPRDICLESTAPAASVFKIVTAAALVQTAGLTPDVRQCYSGGESRITLLDLVEDPKRDRWCATLGEAMGRSLNTVFARLALKNLTPPDLSTMAQAFGFGESIPFDVPVPVSDSRIPEDKLGFARTAAGFWNTTLSPLEGALIANTIANHGEMVRPVIVESVTDANGTLYEAPKRLVHRRVIQPDTAAALTAMLENTTAGGTARRAFRDPNGRAFLPNITVAGKTGTLNRPDANGQFYTWFVGFAPSRSPDVAVAVLALNAPLWRAKANVVARDVLRAYFAARGASGVTNP